MEPVCYNNHQYKIYTNNTDVVVAVTTYGGKRIRSMAKCNLAEDTFNLYIGKDIAIAKCEIAIAKKDRTSALQKASAKKQQADELHYQYCTAKDQVDELHHQYCIACLDYENAIDHFLKIDDKLIEARDKLADILESL